MAEQETRCSSSLDRRINVFQSSLGKRSGAKRIETGTIIDELTGGLARGDLTILCSNVPGAGKSAIVRNMALHISERVDEHVALAPLQDGPGDTCICRLAAIEGGIPLAVIDDTGMAKLERIDSIDATDSLRMHNLDLLEQDGLSLSEVFEWAKASFLEDLERRAESGDSTALRMLNSANEDELPGKGAVIIDSITMLSSLDDIREAVSALKLISQNSATAMVATVSGVGQEQLLDAGCVILVEPGDRDEERGVLNLTLTALKDSTSASAGRSVKGFLDLATLEVSGEQEWKSRKNIDAEAM